MSQLLLLDEETGLSSTIMVSTASHLQCLCGVIHEAASSLADQTLPIETEICHCKPCRQTSGALCPAFVKLSGQPNFLDQCTRYSLEGGRIHRYFCSTCGTRTFDHVFVNGKWFACSGIVEPNRDTSAGDVNVIKVTSHKYINDLGDAGLALLLPGLGGVKLPCYAENSDGPKLFDDDLAKLYQKACSTIKEDKLLASCHCGSIKFYILPPEAIGGKLQHPPLARWLRDNKKKYLALNCACDHCRRATGCSFASNTYVMPENIVTIEDATKSIFDYTSQDNETSDLETSQDSLQAVLPALKFDFTSPGIRRSWCGVCGASVFFERQSRPQCVNISVGILRAKEGSLARNWIDFDWEVCWREQAVDEEFTRALESLKESSSQVL